jgi:Na+/proline symporter
VALGLHAASGGAFIVFAVAAFSLTGGGIVALAVYSLFTGIPVMMVALLGIVINKKMEKPLSISSFAHFRYGRSMQLWVALVILLNMCALLAVEYIVIGGFFSTFLGVPSFIPVLVVGLITLYYTVQGGVYISMWTNQIQTTFVWILLTVVVSVAVSSFNPGPFPSTFPEGLGITVMGLESFVTIGLSLTATAMFSDSLWYLIFN